MRFPTTPGLVALAAILLAAAPLGAAETGQTTGRPAAVATPGETPNPGAAETGHSGGAAAEHDTPEPTREAWSFWGPFGHYDHAQLQRGYRVYREVCSNCHSMNLVSFRNLSQADGPGFTPLQVQALAADFKIKDGPNESGDMFERPGRPSDHFPAPFANEQAARAANGGALPPDMSVLAKARSYERGFFGPIPYFLIDPIQQYSEFGPDYIVSLISKGYVPAPPGVDLLAGQNYNLYMPGHKIAMAKPIADGQVDYTDGSPKTVEQYVKDVAAFLQWAAEPKLEQRKRVGFRVMAFLIVFAGLLYFVKKRIWANVGGDVVIGT